MRHAGDKRSASGKREQFGLSSCSGKKRKRKHKEITGDGAVAVVGLTCAEGKREEKGRVGVFDAMLLN
jgi:hypothetical protein